MFYIVSAIFQLVSGASNYNTGVIREVYFKQVLLLVNMVSERK